MLDAHWQGDHPGHKPVLVWLHGFLGRADDWQAVQCCFPDWPLLSLDLPGHGGSSAIQASGFDQVCTQINHTLRHHQVRAYWLIGYSMGARIAMYYACRAALPGLKGVVVEAGHPGLPSSSARDERQQTDAGWAARFRSESLPAVLTDWYNQSVFADLTRKQKLQLIALRATGHGPALAAMLEATSLSQQPCLLAELHQLRVPFFYLCGARDHKFCQLAQQLTLPLQVIPASGHNAHRENPGDWARQLTHILYRGN